MMPGFWGGCECQLGVSVQSRDSSQPTWDEFHATARIPTEYLIHRLHQSPNPFQHLLLTRTVYHCHVDDVLSSGPYRTRGDERNRALCERVGSRETTLSHWANGEHQFNHRPQDMPDIWGRIINAQMSSYISELLQRNCSTAVSHHISGILADKALCGNWRAPCVFSGL